MTSPELLAAIRQRELAFVAPRLGPPGRLLEIGAGTGEQARALAARGFDVEALDVDGSVYAAQRVWPVRDYDGRRLPFDAQTFDVVFSSNVLEHVADLAGLLREIRRVLRPGGRCVHVLPSPTWRFWTTVTHAVFIAQSVARGRRPAPLLPRRHGERGNLVEELWSFGRRAWRRDFEAAGFRVVAIAPVPLFYTGHTVLEGVLPVEARATLAGVLGPASYLYELACDR